MYLTQIWKHKEGNFKRTVAACGWWCWGCPALSSVRCPLSVDCLWGALVIHRSSLVLLSRFRPHLTNVGRSRKCFASGSCGVVYGDRIRRIFGTSHGAGRGRRGRGKRELVRGNGVSRHTKSCFSFVHQKNKTLTALATATQRCLNASMRRRRFCSGQMWWGKLQVA